MRLGNLCDIVRGSSPRPQGDSRYYGGPIPRLMIADVTRDGMYVTPQIDSLTEEGALKSRPMKKGDVIIAVSGDPGRACILNVDACIHDGFVGLRNLDETKLHKPYLLRYLSFFKSITKKGAVGAIFQNLTTDQIKKIEIPEIELKDQIRIANILSKAEALIVQRKESIRLLDTFLKNTFLEMFGDPVRNEKEWRKVSLEEVCRKIGSGSTPRGGKKSYQKEGVSLIRSLNVHNDEFVYKDLAFVDDAQANELRNVIVEENDVLLNITGASVARCCIVPKDVLPARVNQHVSILRPDPSVLDPIFLSKLFTSNSYQLKLVKDAKSKGATREAITKEEIEQIKVIAPPRQLQTEFVKIVWKAEGLKEQFKTSLQELKNLFGSLSQQAFRGELDLSGLEVTYYEEYSATDNDRTEPSHFNKPLNVDTHNRERPDNKQLQSESAWLKMRATTNNFGITFNDIEGMVVLDTEFAKRSLGFTSDQFVQFLKHEKFNFDFSSVSRFLLTTLDNKVLRQEFKIIEVMESETRKSDEIEKVWLVYDKRK